MGNKIKSKNKKKMKGMGEKFFLEQWEIYEKINADNDKPEINFDPNLIVSEIKKNPYIDYTPIKQLGEGSFGKVILVEHNITGMKRAMKVIKKSLYFEKSNEASVLNEFNILKKIDHQNVVKIYEYYIDNLNYYFITEYCAGGDLFEAVKDIELSESQVSYIMYQILLAVNHLHKLNIMHRDLKPENILVTKIEDNSLYRIKLCDFGTSHLFQEGNKENEVIGSTYYMAPEIFSKKYNFKCDLWSCGVIMYILLTKKIPFLGETKKEIINSIVNKTYVKEPLLKFSDLSKGLIEELLEKDYDKRINAEEALSCNIFDYYKCSEKINKISMKIIDNYIENIKKFKKSNIFQEIAITYLIHNSDFDEIDDAYKLFNKFDNDGNGKIDSKEFYKGLCKVSGCKLNRDAINEVFYNIDTNRNNYIEQEEFVKAAVDKKIFLSENMLKFVFNFFDKEKKGLINSDDIIALFKSNMNNGKESSNNKDNKDLTNELNDIIKLIDKNGDKNISFEEFSQFMKSLLESL